MKIYLSIILLFAVVQGNFAQVAEGIKYQAVARGVDNRPMISKNIAVRITVLESSSQGRAVFEEIHDVITSDLGIFNLVIGQGQRISGVFGNINWGNNEHFVQVEIDPDGGSNFQLMGTTQLLSVPYAFYAKTAETVMSGDNDPGNEIQRISRSGDNVSLSDGGGVVNIRDNDSDPSNEIQLLSLNGNVLTIGRTGGSSVILPSSQSGGSIWNKSGSNIFYNDGNVEIGRNLYLTGRPGLLEVSGQNGNANVRLSNLGNNSNNGNVGVFNFSGLQRARMFVSTDDVGFVQTIGANGRTNINLTYPVGNGNNGAIVVYDDSAEEKAYLLAASDGVGNIATFGPNGALNTRHSALEGFGNNGFIAIYNESEELVTGIYADSKGEGAVNVRDVSGNSQAGMEIDNQGRGIVWGDEKTFRMAHPSEPEKEIWYCAVEGPEVAAYERGKGQLKNGSAWVPFSEHFQVVADPETATIQLTPYSAKTYGLAVVEVNSKGFRVSELMEGRGEFEFSYEVKAVRKGHEDFKVIRNKKEKPIPNSKREKIANGNAKIKN